MMTKQIVLRPTPSFSFDRRRLPLLSGQDTSSRGGVRKVRFAEAVGGTAAECAAVVCCCPCGLANLLYLAVYKLPAGLYRKALRRRRRRRLMKKGFLPSKGQQGSCDETELSIHPIAAAATPLTVVDGGNTDEDVVALEKEMWNKFYGAGFWRSPSQRSDIM